MWNLPNLHLKNKHKTIRTFGSIRLEVFLKTWEKFTGKHLCRNHFFNKVADFKPATLFKQRLRDIRFFVNFENFYNSYCKNPLPKRSSKQYHKINRESYVKVSMSKSLFNKVDGPNCNFVKKRLWHMRISVSFAKILRMPILENIYKQSSSFTILCRLKYSPASITWYDRKQEDSSR